MNLEMLRLGWSKLEVLCPFWMHWHHACKEMFQKLLVGKPAATSCLRQGYLLFWVRSAVTLSHQLLKTPKAGGSTTSGDFQSCTTFLAKTFFKCPTLVPQAKFVIIVPCCVISKNHLITFSYLGFEVFQFDFRPKAAFLSCFCYA